MSSLRSVVVGTGFIGPVHVEGLKRAGVDVVGIIGSTAEKSRSACERLKLPNVYSTLSEALGDPTVDVVHLTTPNALHFEQVQAVLAAGKHCLCEKPLAMNTAQSAELVRLAAASGLVTGVAYNIRFYPLCHEAAARVANGAIGDVISVHGSYVQDWLLYPRDFNWRVMAEDGGELRAVADIGTHWLDLIQFITGSKVTSVCADLRTVHSQRFQPVGGAETFSGSQSSSIDTQAVDVTTEDCGSIMLRFESGANGSLWVSQVTAGRKNSLCFELAGTQSALHWNSESPNQMWIGHRERANELLVRDPSLLDSSASGISQYPGGHNEGFPDTFKQLFRSFYGYIERGDSSLPAPFPTFADGHREILICDAILKSHQERRWMDVCC
ncbi:Gfo/Idh/MocA family protein [Neorhodopirellula pilleata]|uniref:1,5-anhydro-D-fructose reductase n=1 Tax=Neorhodopirellula pilleata TaxID=2714738 RepID=A0A5C5ZW90_9BACT|nr:Gfo/Idh/MocA family oxidoreductase [Neorhodopirellula pilleata]TWT91375.1 1,5-anhydro-D-fructose reductase [Neorhodopirellula pilleata]